MNAAQALVKGFTNALDELDKASFENITKALHSFTNTLNSLTQHNFNTFQTTSQTTLQKPYKTYVFFCQDPYKNQKNMKSTWLWPYEKAKKMKQKLNCMQHNETMQSKPSRTLGTFDCTFDRTSNRTFNQTFDRSERSIVRSNVIADIVAYEKTYFHDVMEKKNP